MIRPTRALRTSIMLSAVTLICIPAQAMAREQRAQPHPIPATSAQTIEPADPRTRVGRANAAARVEPERTSYFNAIQQYAYTDGALFQIYTAPGQITDIMLQEGEELVGPGPVASGDTVRWIIGDTVSGAGAARRVHILVKPTRADIRTNLIINTNRRTYHLELSATNSTYMAAVSWTYPQDALIAVRARVLPVAPPAPAPTPAADPPILNFDYRIAGDRPAWRPTQVFDTGAKVVIVFPAQIAQTDLPPLFVLDPAGKPELVAYRVVGRQMVVDRLFTRAELRLGDKRKQRRVTITRLGAAGQ